ncbi:MAG: hypothetical protein ACQERN_02060 [Thermodesulfobacteriota bacterium]
MGLSERTLESVLKCFMMKRRHSIADCLSEASFGDAATRIIEASKQIPVREDSLIGRPVCVA